ncbi:MAG: glycosyltransferase family 4 protein [Candidatus Hodarchaeota archaeon]
MDQQVEIINKYELLMQKKLIIKNVRTQKQRKSSIKILMPFWRLENFDRFYPRIFSIAKRVKEFHISYISGIPKTEWKKLCTFHKIKLSSNISENFIIQRLSRNFIIRWILNRQSLCKQVKDIEVDLYWGLSGWWTQEFCYDCSQRMKKPYIIDIRGDFKKEVEAKKINWIKRLLSNYRKIKSLKKADLIIPISKKMKITALNLGIDRNKISEVVTPGLDTDMFKPYKIKSEKFTVGYAGRLSPEKGINTLIKIMKLAPEINFLVAGEKQINVKFPKNCTYLGRLPFKEMPHFYNKVDVIIVPSKFESFGFVFLETYACGKPLITSKEIHPPNLPIYGFAIENPTIHDYLKYIRKIKDNVSLKRSSEIRKYIESRYSWEYYGEKMIKLFENVIARA